MIASNPAWLTLPLSSEPSNNPVYKKEGRVKKQKFFHTTFSCNLYPVGFPHFLKQLIQLRREIFKCFFLLPIRRFRIYVHGSLDVLVSHDGLDHFEIALHLAEPGRKGMPEMVAGEFRKHQWLAAFPCSTETLISVIAVHNPFNCAVYTGGIRQGTEAVLKNETRVSIHLLSDRGFSACRATVLAILQFTFRKEAHPALFFDQLPYKVCRRILKQFLWRPVLLDFSVLHHQYLCAEFQGFFNIMRDKQTSTAPKGSSISRISGEAASALAIPTLCCCPPESSEG